MYIIYAVPYRLQDHVATRAWVWVRVWVRVWLRVRVRVTEDHSYLNNCAVVECKCPAASGLPLVPLAGA